MVTVGNRILGKQYPLNLYFAYGVRNSFGIDFDPLTGYLWDTENGPDYGDEINFVEPGFNSGALKIFGQFNSNSNYQFHNIVQSNIEEGPEGLVTFNGNGRYSEPELSWQNTVAPTSITFLDSKKLGNNYQYDIFVANAGEGKIYHFDLSHDRKHLELKNSLADKVVDSELEEDLITFAEGFGLITDLEMNPYDGYLYVVAPIKGDSAGGSVYKIVPTSPDTILFPSGVETTQGNGQLFPENNDFVICNKLASLEKALMNEWEQGQITDEQAILLGERAKILMTESSCVIR